MDKQFSQVADRATLEQLMERSNEQPVILFKHSTSCPISAAAYREMSQVKPDVSIVIVQTARDVSKEIAERTGVRHESPQAFVVRNGEVAWTASHYDVTAEAVEEAVRANV